MITSARLLPNHTPVAGAKKWVIRLKPQAFDHFFL
jgi:hypothetical protein